MFYDTEFSICSPLQKGASSLQFHASPSRALSNTFQYLVSLRSLEDSFIAASPNNYIHQHENLSDICYLHTGSRQDLRLISFANSPHEQRYCKLMFILTRVTWLSGNYHAYAGTYVPAGFQADMMILLSLGLVLIV